MLTARRSVLKGMAAFAAMPSIGCVASAKEGIFGRKWYKGNLHTHTLVSDGRAFPAEAALLYRDIGYDFLVFSDHNLVHDHEMWVTESNHARRRFALKNAERFAREYPQCRPQTRKEADGTSAWRYGPFKETADAVGEPGRFLLMSGCEYNDTIAGGVQLHCNVINSYKAHQLKKRCKNIAESFRNMYGSYRRLTADEDALFMVNHPLWWFYDVDPLILADCDEVQFFEIDNLLSSLPFDKNPDGAYDGDKLWDFALARRIKRGSPIIFVTASDDTHSYDNLYLEVAGKRSTYGNHGYVAVAAKELAPASIVEAMRKGDFYASTGVELLDVRMEGATLSVQVSKAQGEDCRIIFYGTKKDARLDYSPGEERLIADFAAELGSKKPVPSYVGKRRRIATLPADAGVVLKEVKGMNAAYTMSKDDMYVRAKVISGKATAWTQPLVNL